MSHLRRITTATILLAVFASLLIVNLRPSRIHAQQGTTVPGTEAPKPAYQCKGITKKGERCKRKVKADNTYCWQHKSQAK